MTNFLETELIDHVFRNAAYTSPTTIYVGLFTAAPGEAGGGTEVSGNAYTREPVTFGAPTDGVSSNSAQVEFPAATPAGWGTITHFALFDAVTAGNMLMHSALDASKTIGVDDIFRFPVGNLTVQFS